MFVIEDESPAVYTFLLQRFGVFLYLSSPKSLIFLVTASREGSLL